MTKSEEDCARVHKWALSLLSSGALFLMLSFLVQPSIAVEKGDVTTEKSAIEKTKCWERMPPDEKEPMSPEYCTVCKAYEEVLNTRCEAPEKLQCNWTLPPGEKRFKKPKWVQLDPTEHWGLIKDLNVGGVRADLREEVWKEKEARIKKEIDAGRSGLSVTTLDIDHDEDEEQLVRYNLLPCKDTPGSIFAVIDPKTKRFDWLRDRVVSDVNAFSEGSEILLYEGEAFMFKIENIYYNPDSPPAKVVMVYKGFSSSDGRSFGSLNICRFAYLKGRK